MGVIDHVGSAVNLAKQMRMDLDPDSLETRVPTATLRLLLDMLIDLGSPGLPIMQIEQRKTVAEMIAKRGGEG